MRFSALLALSLLPAGLLCQAATGTPKAVEKEMEVWPTDGWPVASPGAHGLDEEKLARFVAKIREDGAGGNAHGLLIVRHGYLVLEEYFDGWRSERLHTLQSVTKSVTSALVGIAIDRGEISGVTAKVLDFFPQLRPKIKHLDQRKTSLELEDLLTMRTGTDFHESGSDSPLHRMNRLRDGWLGFVLDSRMIREPGTTFHYDSGGVILLSGVLEKVSGLHADAYAARHLFAPLGIEEARWFKNAAGLVHTGGGLDLRPRDMARFGLLYLRGGRWQGKQVLSRDWIDASLKRHVATVRRQSGHDLGYGYLWWVWSPPADRPSIGDFYGAHGFMGQYIFILPKLDMVVVFTGGARTWSGEKRPVEWLYEHILPAVEP